MRCNGAQGSSRRRLILSVLFAALFLPVPERKGFAQTDPLLREEWMDEESAQMRGALLRAGRLLESRRPGASITDSRNHLYEPGPGGEDFLFDPARQVWRPSVFATEDLLTANEQAKGLVLRGLREEALLLWKAIQYTYLLLPEGVGAKEMAAEATAEIQKLSSRSDFADMNRRTDPVPLFDSGSGKTCLFFSREKSRICFPGAWQVAGVPANPGEKSTVIYLKHRQMIFSRKRIGHETLAARENLRELYDRYGAISHSLYLRSDSERTDLSPATLCPVAKPSCCVMQSSTYRRKNETIRSIEFLRRDLAGVVFFSLQYDPPLLEEDAIRILTSILETEKIGFKVSCE